MTDTPECDFCGYDSDEQGWIVTHPCRGYGAGPASEGPYTLCGLCYRSSIVSGWLVGARPEGERIARDQLMIGNVLRATIIENAGSWVPWDAAGGMP